MKCISPFSLQPEAYTEAATKSGLGGQTHFYRWSQFIVSVNLGKSCEIAVWFYLLAQQTPCTCCIDRACCWVSEAHWGKCLLQLHVFQLSPHFRSRSCYSDHHSCSSKVFTMPLKATYSLNTSFSADEPGICFTGKMRDLGHELPPPPRPSLKFYLCHFRRCQAVPRP